MPLARWGAHAWFCGVLTHSVKVMNFLVIFGFKIFLKYFTFILAIATSQGLLVVIRMGCTN